MTAVEARKKAYSVNTESKNSQLLKIRSSIEMAASQGQYETLFYGTILEDIKDVLDKEGYIVHTTQFERNDSYTKISW